MAVVATASVSRLAGGAARPAAAAWRIDSAVAQAPRLLFRRVLYLSFALRGPAERIVFDDSAAVLQGLFEPLDFAVSESFETLLPAALTVGEEGAVLVRPEGPGELRRVELTDSFGAGHVLELHRLVAGVLEEEAAASGEVVAGVAELTTELPEEGFGLRLRAGATPVPLEPENVVALLGEPHQPGSVEQRDEGVLVKLPAPRQVVELRLPGLVYPEDSVFGLHRADGDAVSEEPTTVLRTGSSLMLTEPLSFQEVPVFTAASQLPTDESAMESATSIYGSEHRFRPAAEFIGADFVILHRESEELPEEKARSLRLRSYPTGPRLGIAVPGDLASTVFFWQVPGEVGRGTPAEDGTVTAGEALAGELNRYLADRFDGTRDRLDVALVIESDAPCCFTLSELELPHHLEVDLVVADSGDFVLPEGTASSRDKEKLRFPGDQLAVETRTMEVPSGVEVLEATLKIAESFGDERLAPGAAAPGPVPGGKTGVLLEPERSVGQLLTPPEGLSVRGLLLGVMALVDGTELLVEVEEDAGGVPSGRKLGEAALELGEAGRRLWAAVRFDLSFLPSQPYWLLIRTATGRGVWLTEPGTEGVSMLERSGPQAPWRLLSTHRDATGSYRVLSTAEELGDTCPVTFSVDGQTVEPSSRGAEFTVYELAPAVDEFLSTVPSGGPVLVPLAFSAAVAGFLTVYPPVIKYRIPQ